VTIETPAAFDDLVRTFTLLDGRPARVAAWGHQQRGLGV
jgi:hypothetical protein